jgi:hypothetical protein
MEINLAFLQSLIEMSSSKVKEGKASPNNTQQGILAALSCNEDSFYSALVECSVEGETESPETGTLLNCLIPKEEESKKNISPAEVLRILQETLSSCSTAAQFGNWISSIANIEDSGGDKELLGLLNNIVKESRQDSMCNEGVEIDAVFKEHNVGIDGAFKAQNEAGNPNISAKGFSNEASSQATSAARPANCENMHDGAAIKGDEEIKVQLVNANNTFRNEAVPEQIHSEARLAQQAFKQEPVALGQHVSMTESILKETAQLFSSEASLSVQGVEEVEGSSKLAGDLQGENNDPHRNFAIKTTSEENQSPVKTGYQKTPLDPTNVDAKLEDRGCEPDALKTAGGGLAYEKVVGGAKQDFEGAGGEKAVLVSESVATRIDSQPQELDVVKLSKLASLIEKKVSDDDIKISVDINQNQPESDLNDDAGGNSEKAIEVQPLVSSKRINELSNFNALGDKNIIMEVAGGEKSGLSQQNQLSDRALESLSMTKELQSVPNHQKNYIMSQVIEKAVFNLKSGQTSMNISLKPDTLGQLKMQIVTENNSVMVRIITEAHVVKEVIENNIQQLKTELNNQGLVIGRFEVSVGQGSNPNQGGQEHLPFRNNEAAQALRNGNGSTSKEETQTGAFVGRSAGSENVVDYFA